MKVIATVRTLNEQNNIGNFCHSYKNIADKVLVADGGSTDNTVQIAKSFPNVEVRDFKKRVKLFKSYWRNPHGEHINFLIDWAIDEGADWIIFDDCDCLPNYALKNDARTIFKITEHDFVFVTRLYLWGTDKHFPKMAKITGDWTPSLWAWRANLDFRASETDPLRHEFTLDISKVDKENLMPPYCLLHYFVPTPEIASRKLQWYRESGQHLGMKPQLETGGELSPLPEWARR